MKNWLIICFLFVASTGFGQHLKKKFYGTYTGVIPAYKLDIGSDVVDVASASITIVLSADGVVQQLGNSTKNGTWKIISTEKNYFILSLRLEGQLAEEQVVLDKKSKTMVREGIFPQPDAELAKEH
jgi:hypothetical protein